MKPSYIFILFCCFVVGASINSCVSSGQPAKVMDPHEAYRLGFLDGMTLEKGIENRTYRTPGEMLTHLDQMRSNFVSKLH